MSTELPKNYDPAQVEPAANGVWMNENLFHADPSDPGEPYCIVIPPPNVTGALHLGHAINDTIQDILIRQHRMRGFNTLWVPGLDHAGIATQAVVEKQLKEKENLTRHDVGREGLVERIWAWKEQYGTRILDQLKRLGCSCDWSRSRFTLDEMCARAVRETFFKLFKDGLIYRGKRLVNWDTFLQTSISDDEIYHETVKTHLWHIRYPIVDGAGVGSASADGTPAGEDSARSRTIASAEADPAGDASSERGTGAPPVHLEHGRGAHATFMVVATTRPETMLGDTAVAVHSQDPRWNWAIGKHVRLPLTDRLIPIIADDILVDPKFGTGVVKVTPAHDPNDYAVWQRHKGELDEIDIINILTPDGRLVDDPRWQKYVGMKRDAARQKVVEDLKAAGLLEKEEPYETQVGHSDRSKTPIEPYLSDQWFVKMAPLAEPALEVVRDGTIEFFPARFANTYLDWLGEKRDWPISRQLWWGHRIPVWTRQMSWSEWVDGPATRLAAFFLSNSDPICCRIVTEGGATLDFVKWAASNDRSTVERVTWYVSFAPAPRRADLLDECELTDSMLKEYGFVQDPDVLDTWFSSALWPHSTLGWPEETLDLKKWYPTSVLVTSRDIITLWVARMVMMGLYNMGHGEFLAESAEEARLKIANCKLQIANSIPFHAVHIHTTILDGKGERMSKSKGNGVDPVEIIESHGADALRFTLTQMATETQDVRLPVKKDAQGRNTSDKFDVGKHFCNKIWQVSQHFAFANLEKIAPEEPDERKWSLADRWIVSRFNRTLEAANSAIETYRFDQYAKVAYDFFWNDFCAWYVEAIKPALRDSARAGQTATVLAAVLDGSLRLLHPMIPFITEVLWWRLNEIRPIRGLSGHIECPPSNRLIKAGWPTTNAPDAGAELQFGRLQEIIVAIRNIRTQYSVPLKQSVAVSIQAPAEETPTLLRNRELIELLATCSVNAVGPQIPVVANSTHLAVAGSDLYLQGLVDPEAEKQLKAKKRGELEKQIGAMEGRLSNESYISKAPPNLVEQTKEQLAKARAELGKLGA
jgi:valyl-tRNA synthetase